MSNMVRVQYFIPAASPHFFECHGVGQSNWLSADCLVLSISGPRLPQSIDQFSSADFVVRFAIQTGTFAAVALSSIELGVNQRSPKTRFV